MGVLGTKHPGRDKDYAFMDWSGGLNAHTASECSPNEFSALCNFKPRRKGGWETRQGLDRVTNTPAPGKIGSLAGFNGTLCCSALDGATWKLYRLDASDDPTVIGALSGKPDLEPFDGKLQVADTAQLKDVTPGWVLAPVPGAPKASQVSQLYNRLILSGDPDNPATLWYSTDVKSTAAFSQQPIDDADGGQIAAHRIHKGHTWIWKRNPATVHTIIGFESPSVMVRSQAYEKVTALNHWGVISSGDDLVWPGHKGVMSLRKLKMFEGDYSKSYVSDNIEPIYKAYADTELVGGYCPEDGLCMWQFNTANYGYLLVYDSVVGVWSTYRFLFDGTDAHYPTAIADIDGVTYIGASNGHIYKLGSTCKDDDHQYGSVTFARSAYQDFGMPHNQKLMKYLAYYFEARMGATFTLDFYKDYTYDPWSSQDLYLPISGDVTVDELDLLVDDWDFPFDPSFALAKNQKFPGRFWSLMMGLRNVQPTTTPFILGGVSIKGAVLKR